MNLPGKVADELSALFDSGGTTVAFNTYAVPLLLQRQYQLMDCFRLRNPFLALQHLLIFAGKIAKLFFHFRKLGELLVLLFRFCVFQGQLYRLRF